MPEIEIYITIFMTTSFNRLAFCAPKIWKVENILPSSLNTKIMMMKVIARSITMKRVKIIEIMMLFEGEITLVKILPYFPNMTNE